MKHDLSDLLDQKDFEDLTMIERNFVLSEISEEAYNEQRETIVMAQLIMADDASNLRANPSIAIAASTALQQRKKTGVFAIFTHKVPTWAAVAACALLFTLFNYSGIFGQSVEKNHVADVSSIDTVYIEKIITEFRDLKPFQEKPVSDKVQPHNSENLAQVSVPPKPDKTPTYSDEMLNAEQINYTALLQNYSSSNGVSLQNDSITRMVNRTVY